MKISPDEARRRLGASQNLTRLAIVDELHVNPQTKELQPNITHIEKLRPKRTGAPNIPEFVRDTMASLVAQGGTGPEIGNAFGVSKMSVSNAARGMSGGRPPDEDRRRKMEERQSEVKDTALTKLMLSLKLITEDNLVGESPKGLSLIAKNMASVMHQIEVTEQEKSPVNIIVYTPEMKRTEHFKVIDV